MGDEFTLEDVLIILQRRFLYFLIPALLIAPIGVITVMLLPAKYSAQGTILVESQQIPTDFVRSTINAYAQERIQTIRQRVMTRNRLLEVADEYELFPRSLGLSETERVKRMRNNLRVDLITTTANRGSGDGTIAFTVAYTDQDPRKAYLVANKFMTLFLDEDVRSRTAGASNTTEFFEQETGRLRRTVAELENQISEYKTTNSGALPEQLNTNLDMLERRQRELSTAQSTISQLEEERRFLENQLISGSAGDNSMSAELSRLESELARLRATYRDSYPEVVAKRDEIAALRRQMAPSEEIRRLRRALSDSEDALADIENTEEPDPDALAQAEAAVNDARTELSERIEQETRRGSDDIAGVQIEGRIAVVENRIKMLNKQIEDAQENITNLETRIARTPEVERGLAALTRDYENMFQEYQDILTKQQDAQLAENLEESQQTEKFSILEPALNPERPSSPDRAKLIFAALFAALGIGGATAMGVELVKARLRGRNHIANVLDGQPIAVIPYFSSEHDRRPRVPFIGRKSKKSRKSKRKRTAA
ncbi:hypothetical protein PUV54_02735 [Hyphococcus flavus]|uniref:Lipopolysaccharide biosynthesis protein n=1 Tax=Hyphococcus flavus TaxID=1866326 RepID=A0AAE9ZJA5_9PROT|nr:hypothetical protein [Hyphococcus flavus]WDI32106.1 hypothetical protein PUV54_02735 [Hyphococcus flavus]